MTPLNAWWDEIPVTAEAIVVAVRGDLDYLDAVALKHRLIDLARDGARDIVVDLTRAGTVVRAIVPALVVAVRRAAVFGGRLAVAAEDPFVVDLLRTSGLDEQLAVGPSAADVLPADDSASSLLATP